jgi:hypothetical protein|tara:strand:+ start:1190 stop:1318 length:129 start_codon:yes stop_codon:yes gene_type:complete
MPSGKGTYGRKRGRPSKAGKKMTKSQVVKMIKSKAKKRRKKK